MQACEFRKQLAKRLAQFFFSVGADGKGFLKFPAEPAQGIGCPRTEHLRIPFHAQQLRQAAILLAESKPFGGMAKMAELYFIFGMTGQSDGREPIMIDAEFD